MELAMKTGVTGAKRALNSKQWCWQADGLFPRFASRWLFQFIGHLTAVRKERLEKAFPATTGNSSDGSESGMDVAIFVYSIWPAEYHKYDSDYNMEGLQWLNHFIRRRFGPLVPVFWLGPKPIVQSVLGLHNPLSSKEHELVQYRTGFLLPLLNDTGLFLLSFLWGFRPDDRQLVLRLHERSNAQSDIRMPAIH